MADKLLKKIILKIEGMHCVSCAFDIDGALEETEGVEKAETNYASQLTHVTFDQTVLSEKDLLLIIQKVGYTSTPHQEKK